MACCACPARCGEAYAITRALIEDSRNHLLLGGPIAIDCPIRLLHGQRDPDVPCQETALRIAERVRAEDVRLILVKDGDHRLSRPQDLLLLHARPWRACSTRMARRPSRKLRITLGPLLARTAWRVR